MGERSAHFMGTERKREQGGGFNLKVGFTLGCTGQAPKGLATTLTFLHFDYY